MKKFTLIGGLFLAVVLLFACKKETTESPLSVVGYWRGNAYIYNTAVLNRADGSSRLYFRMYALDTSSATILDGYYTNNGGSFKAYYLYNGGDTLFLESRSISRELITGQLYSTITPESIDFKFYKQ